MLSTLTESRKKSQEYGLESDGICNVITCTLIMSHQGCQDAIPRG